MTRRTLIIGYGYLGARVAGRLAAGGEPVLAVSRHAPETLPAGVSHRAADLDDPATLRGLLRDGDRVFHFAPPPRRGTTDTRLRALLAANPEVVPSRLVLVSTSGVYGDCQGAWVTESRPVAPRVDRARRRLDAEQVVRQWAAQRDTRLVILRVPGLYGPGRLPLARLQRGEPVLRRDQSPWSNRIHVHDLARCCVRAMAHDDPAPLYNVSDGHPSTMTDYFLQVAAFAGLPAPPQISLAEAREQLSAGMLEYLAESRRLDNTLMRTHLGVTPRYPDLATGLAACR